MNEKKPSNIAEYVQWLTANQQYRPEIIRPYYTTVTTKIKTDFEAGSFWAELNGQLNEFNDQFLVATEYRLLMTGNKPEVLIKPFDSFLLKTFRKNILDNKRWPDEPEGGWVNPSSGFSRINDVLRTLLVVKYLDGVEFLVSRLESLCRKQAINCRKFFEAREEGYYAGHVYVKQPFEIPRLTWDTEIVEISVEIQVTTQLQETIRRLLHKYYEEGRQRPSKAGAPWQWDYKSDEFSANYLGHILHYVEGMIMEVREKQKR
jgi:hypothetical protein